MACPSDRFQVISSRRKTFAFMRRDRRRAPCLEEGLSEVRLTFLQTGWEHKKDRASRDDVETVALVPAIMAGGSGGKRGTGKGGDGGSTGYGVRASGLASCRCIARRRWVSRSRRCLLAVCHVSCHRSFKTNTHYSWYDSSRLLAANNIPTEINLLEDYESPAQGTPNNGSLDFGLTPGETAHRNAVLALKPGSYLGRVTFWGNRETSKFHAKLSFWGSPEKYDYWNYLFYFQIRTQNG
jgi:hypothetical protein